MRSLTLALVVALGQQAAPAPGIAPSTPADCVRATRDFIIKRQQQLRPPTGMTAEIVSKVEQEKTAMAGECAAKFDLATVAPGDLPTLADLYTEAGRPEWAKRALDRGLSLANATPADRAAILAQAVRSGLREPKSPERNARLEGYVVELDRLPDSVLDQKFAAHNSLNNYYRADDIDDGIIRHSTWMIDASKTFTPEMRTRLGLNIATAYANMAEAWAGQGMTEKAIALLRQAQSDWKDVPRADDGYFSPIIARLELVGTAAAPIFASRWLNMPAGTTTIAMPGSVTLLEFTAHWCGPCKESYPGLKRLLAKYGHQGFRVVFATELYGYFGADRDLAPDAEFERDREYFTKAEGFTAPIAVPERQVREIVDGRPLYWPDRNLAAYKVGGIPQIHLIDKQGKIRLIMTGYDDTNESKLSEMIEALLKGM